VVDTTNPHTLNVNANDHTSMIHRDEDNEETLNELMSVAPSDVGCEDSCDGDLTANVTATLFKGNCDGDFQCHDTDGLWTECSGSGDEVDRDSVNFEHGTWGIKYSCKDHAENEIAKCRTVEITEIPTSYPTAAPTPAPTPECRPCDITEWTSEQCSESCGDGELGGLRVETRIITPDTRSTDGLPFHYCEQCPTSTCDGFEDGYTVEDDLGNLTMMNISTDDTSASGCRVLPNKKSGGYKNLALRREVKCNTQQCEQCEVEIDDWSSCTKSCDIGEKARSYIIHNHGEKSINLQTGEDGEHSGVVTVTNTTVDCEGSEAVHDFCNTFACPEDCEHAGYVAVGGSVRRFRQWDAWRRAGCQLG